jgi:hypothetical protein
MSAMNAVALTLPFASTSALTMTIPEIRALRASGVYSGGKFKPCRDVYDRPTRCTYLATVAFRLQ